MQSADPRITELEVRLDAQAAEIAELKSRLPAPRIAGKAVEEGVRITHVQPSSSFVKPTDKELEQLYTAVFARHPRFKPNYTGKFAAIDSAYHFRSFRLAFARIGFLGAPQLLTISET